MTKKPLFAVTAPATTANVGCGFDCLGMAFNLYNTVEIFKSDSLYISGCDEKYQGSHNLVAMSITEIFRHCGVESYPLGINIKADIPISRGLGSSASLIACGALAANKLIGANLSKQEIFQTVLPLEGHADNLAACIFGGFTSVLTDGGIPVVSHHAVSSKLHFIALVPNCEVSTQTARGILPKTIDFSVAVKQISHLPELIYAFSVGDVSRLNRAVGDYLHEPYRKQLIPCYEQAKRFAILHGAQAFFISGSGSTCIAVADTDISRTLQSAISDIEGNWRVIPLTVDYDGAKVEEK